MTTHTIKRGFDIRIDGKADKKLEAAGEPVLVAVETADFPGIKPKALVEPGQRVRTGEPLFLDKNDRETVFCSPATGKVKEVVFGERRFLQRVVVEPESKDEFVENGLGSAKDRADLVAAIKRAGLWPLLRQRPIGRIADGSADPAAIFVNGMDTEPLAACPAFATEGRQKDLQAGIDLLRKLTSGRIHVCLRAAGDHQSELRALSGVEIHDFDGPHPAGLVGTHIRFVQPLKQNEVAWYLKAQELALLGEWARSGRYPSMRVVAIAGTRAPVRAYFKVRQGAVLPTVLGGKVLGDDVRVINGTVLTGRAVPGGGFLGFYATTVTCIPEGKGRRDLFGWAVPGFSKHSFHRSVFGWLARKPAYDLDARLHGGRRPIVNIGSWESVTPLDIYPTYLMRAIQANDLDEALRLGLLEVTEEDVALCSFVDPCKIDAGEVIRAGLDMYAKEA
ncbi:MAG: Na(+)-translocating NADH-quinone reductase subunit A [Planctomycetota bacterium]